MTLSSTRKLSDIKWEFEAKNKMRTCEVNKISLSCLGDKRLVLDDGIHTLAYFHKAFTDKDFHKKKRFSQMITNKNKCEQINLQ